MDRHKTKVGSRKSCGHFAGLNLKPTTAELCILKIAPLFHVKYRQAAKTVESKAQEMFLVYVVGRERFIPAERRR